MQSLEKTNLAKVDFLQCSSITMPGGGSLGSDRQMKEQRNEIARERERRRGKLRKAKS